GRPGAASGHTVARGGGTDSRRPAALFGQAPQRDDEPPCRSRRPAIPWHRGAAGPDYRSRGSSVMGRAARKNLSADCRQAPAISLAWAALALTLFFGRPAIWYRAPVTVPAFITG